MQSNYKHLSTIFLFLFSFYNIHAQVNLTQGLVAYYPFNSNANDESGNGNNGIPNNGASLTTDRFGNPNNAYYFDGIDDYIRIINSSSLNPSNASSVALTFSTEQNTVQTIIGKIGYTTGVGTQFQVAINFGPFPGVLFGTNPIANGCASPALNAAYVNTGSSINNNQWYCVVATFENGIQKIYLNGTLIQTKNAGFTNLNQCTNADIQIGSWWAGDVQRFKGKVDDIRIYNRALNQEEVNALATSCQTQTNTCNNWLKTTNQVDAVKIGDLDISGNQITIEANFNRTAPYTGGYLYGGDIVSKHADPSDCNYLLRSNNAEITTSNGFFQTPPICEIVLNKTYHAAMTYDGITLKFFRNGVLLSQVPASGNLILNNWITTIGAFAPGILGTPENMSGFINEVRIWNVARSQTDIQAYMNTSLPTPAIQTGLLAYYTFDNLLNKQGNVLWNGTLAGSAAINTTNTSCNPILGETCVTNTPQLCTGSLGAPVVNITFGNGNNPGQPLSAIVPGASTTLTYVAVNGNPALPIPIDGQYSITNNVPNNAPWFFGMPDHTPGDVNGYMAFYNSQEAAGLEFYKQTVSGLCGGTTYEFAAWIANCLNPAILNGVDPDITFRIERIDGSLVAQFNTGPIAETSSFTWKQFGFFFTSPAGETSVVLKMINNNVGGTGLPGNDVAIDDITFRPCGPNVNASFNNQTVLDSIAVCEGSTTTLFGNLSTGYQTPGYLWQVSTDNAATWNNIPASGANQLTLTAPFTGSVTNYKYRLLAAEASNINSPNCRIISNIITLTSLPLPQAAITVNPVCTGNTPLVTFRSSSQSFPFSINYTVNGTAYTQTNLQNNSTFNLPVPVDNTTSIVLNSVTDNKSCSNLLNTTISVTLNETPQGGITGAEGCAGDSSYLNFTASSGTAPFAIKITDGTTVYTIQNLNSVTKFTIPNTINTVSKTFSIIEISDSRGIICSRTSGFTSPTAQLIVKPSPQLQISAFSDLCLAGAVIELTQASETSGLTGQGNYSGRGVLPNGFFNPAIAGAGVHYIKYNYIGSNGCSSIDSQAITVNRGPVANAGQDVLVCNNSTVQLNASGGETYQWQPVTGLNNSTIPNPILTAISTTQYILTATDLNGCSSNDTMMVIVGNNSSQQYYVPNSFTPNNDNINDCFGITQWGLIELEEFSVHDRWGQRIFFTSTPGKCWDGNFNGVQQPPGSYAYQIKAKDGCGTIYRKGLVSLIR